MSTNGQTVHKLEIIDHPRRMIITPPIGMLEDLKRNGWCFISYENEVLIKFMTELSSFFSLSPEAKQKYAGPHGFGYSLVDHKEGIRVLTGQKLQLDFFRVELVPMSLQDIYKKASSTIDMFTMSLVWALSQPFFKMQASDLAREADIPVAYTSIQSGFGMLDVAHYFNKTKAPYPQPKVGSSVEDVNCVPHYDPGLLSVSFYSNNEGLQLLDVRTNKWIDGPNNTLEGQRNIAVVWLGEAAVKATNGAVKAGVHRVIYPTNGMPRLTSWYEMCTVKQATEPEDKYLNTEKVIVPNLAKEAQQVEVKKGEKVVDVLKKIERTRGVPMSKAPRIDDFFKGYP